MEVWPLKDQDERGSVTASLAPLVGVSVQHVSRQAEGERTSASLSPCWPRGDDPPRSALTSL